MSVLVPQVDRSEAVLDQLDLALVSHKGVSDWRHVVRVLLFTF